MAATYGFQQQDHEWRQQYPSHQHHPQHFTRMAALSNASTTATPGIPVLATGNDHNQPSLLANQDPQAAEDNRRTLEWIAQLLIPASRESALLELSKKREQVPELALVLWHSFGVMTALLEEIISVYPLLNPSQLTAAASNRVCNALALLQCVASHNDTRGLFLTGKFLSKSMIRISNRAQPTFLSFYIHS